ncbi:MAG: putative CRISPR-associated protein, APE2256 family [Phormidium sp. OSCR]|nr:MAG: putative CRISPR-associated protein, APE2256 family [Phormidium sp. OSCR]
MQTTILSTIGTSLLTNQINRNDSDEKTWYPKLRDSANLKETELPNDSEVRQIISILKERSVQKLQNSNIQAIRRASAELNGIYGFYHDDLSAESVQGDFHWLIATDTYQGITTAQIVKDFLLSQGLLVDIYAPGQLSTASSQSFSDGVDDLIGWLEENIKPLQENPHAKICFNLVGGFKSLQGYLNTIGMFYADEIIYIFEGENSELITIPRLPITVDYEGLSRYKRQLALMAAGATIAMEELQGIPESMIYPTGEPEVMLSLWGQLVWNQCKKQLLSSELLDFPYLDYRNSFKADYKAITSATERLKLQEDLAKVSKLLIESQGDTSVLNLPFNYTRYKGTSKNQKIDHFRVNLSQRVSCEQQDDKLVLRYYGTHNHVEGKEGIRH